MGILEMDTSGILYASIPIWVGDKKKIFSPDKPHIIIMLEEGLKEGSLLTFLPPP